jgi:L-ascorbate metabolism protein UlaG (beta-lactamase superfamily)
VTPASYSDPAGSRLTWLGHATVVLELGGACLITDPVLRPRIAHLRRHVAPPEPPPRVDAVLISHLHRDHFDVPSLRVLTPDAPVVVPRGAAGHLRRAPRPVIELSAGERTRFGDAGVVAVPALHDGRRSPVGRAAETLGFVVEADGLRVYFAGDTERYDAMAELAPLDVALLPIWGWGPSLGAGHMDPEQAAEAVALLRPAVAVPVHWGTFLPVGTARRYGHLLTSPPRRFAARCEAVAPATDVRVLRPGESLPLPS